LQHDQNDQRKYGHDHEVVAFIATAIAAISPAMNAFHRVFRPSTSTRNATRLKSTDGISGKAIRLSANKFRLEAKNHYAKRQVRMA
jgi:hypothetical protein